MFVQEDFSELWKLSPRVQLKLALNLWGINGNKYLTKEIKCESVFERIETLIKNGDGFVILQGGTGTLLELAAVWELANKGLMNNKPIACHSSMWKKIVTVMNEQMKLEGRNAELVKSFDTVGEIAEFLSQKLN